MCRECRRVRRESNVPDIDAQALQRLMAYVWDAVDAQPTHIGDQLAAEMRAGNVGLRLEPSGEAPVVVVSVAGVDLAEVDVRNLLEEAE
jgi:hypothetical protein